MNAVQNHWGDAPGASDQMAEFAIGFLVSGRGTARELVRVLVQQWSTHAALEFVLVLSLTANAIEETLKGDEVNRLSQDAWRMAALLGVDIYDAQALGLPHRTGADLVSYWRQHDSFF